MKKALEKANSPILGIFALALFIWIAHFSYELVRRPHPDLNHGYDKAASRRISQIIDRENRHAKYMKENPTAAFDVFDPEVKLVRNDGSVVQ